ncbi:hypothetical protein [Janthinobacterium lividum]|uniref:hypothetical protein n=1 Tax=Janthinobacterium lividum TaxID=29581 RepID=UPI00111410EA|nr:hypothetical protein [Janthinobacterium lividum]
MLVAFWLAMIGSRSIPKITKMQTKTAPAPADEKISQSGRRCPGGPSLDRCAFIQGIAVDPYLLFSKRRASLPHGQIALSIRGLRQIMANQGASTPLAGACGNQQVATFV